MSLTDLKTQLDSQISALTTQRNTLQAKITETDALLATAQTLHTSLDAAIPLETEINTLTAALAAANANLTACGIARTRLESEKAELAAQLQALTNPPEVETPPQQNLRLPHSYNAATGELTGVFAVYLTDQASSGTARTNTMKSYVDRVAAAGGINGVIVFCNAIEVQEKTIPTYIASKGLAWWADSVYSVYTRNPAGFSDYITRCKALNAAGYILDDASSLSIFPLATQEAVVRIIKTVDGDKPIVASYAVLAPVNTYRAANNAIINVLTARQLYRHELAATSNPTGVLANWIATRPMQIANLECFTAGRVTTSARHLREMVQHIRAGGIKNIMMYAAVDIGTFKVWNHPALWDAVQEEAVRWTDGNPAN
jgi:hypothetical protein